MGADILNRAKGPGNAFARIEPYYCIKKKSYVTNSLQKKPWRNVIVS